MASDKQPRINRESTYTSWNKAHLSQPEGTPFTISPLKDILGLDSFTFFGDALLASTASIDTLPLSKLQKLHFLYLTNTSDLLSSQLSPHISIDDITSGFWKWKENTATSPPHRYLGHYKSFLVSDSNDNKPEQASFDKSILQTINTIFNVTISSGVPLTRWLTSLVVMINKIFTVPCINKIRVVNIYEVDYNLILKYFWPNKSTKHTVKNKTIGENQWECISGGSVDLVALINEFIIKTHRLTFRNLVVFKNNAKSYCDRIINIHPILHSRRFEMSDDFLQTPLHHTPQYKIKSTNCPRYS